MGTLTEKAEDGAVKVDEEKLVWTLIVNSTKKTLDAYLKDTGLPEREGLHAVALGMGIDDIYVQQAYQGRKTARSLEIYSKLGGRIGINEQEAVEYLKETPAVHWTMEMIKKPMAVIAG